ncbi:Leucine-rich repeat and immunoglobulin-like domain-containing nogo receptor-interacting protein 2 [Armadillidium nasatum]|uniref:Leucine-rich repeat and immunoglobulin-like domain-containing nogo receptor-interacting protein 2 n=1 Tax=Armadillidium nasatum TaxID=96803 RepID=A0A5N5TKD6_9CRUS|nr:Leucine-rich repeat and immunoglobulin-like domain-containing nogo receptor-interacting protein 2 [Armadillidium nasatum]
MRSYILREVPINRIHFFKSRGGEKIEKDIRSIIGISSSTSMKLWLIITIGLFRLHVQAFCPSTCICDETHPSGRCENAQLSFVPTLLDPRLKSLNLAYNTIHSISDVLQYYELLEVLDLSHNNISNLGGDNFAVQKRLKDLNLSFNNLTHLDSKVFNGLKSLFKLDLSHNFISEISKSVFSSTPKLNTLLLSKNRLHTLNSVSFKGLKNLQVLDLCDNFFREVPRNCLTILENLETLLICRNRITYLKEFDLINPSLVTLSLLSNSISVIDGNALKHLINLKSLDVGDNLLGEIPSVSFKYLHSLESLDISRNKFSIIRNKVFDDLQNLNEIHISRCPYLEIIESRSFSQLRNLKNLVISHNKELTNIPPHLFSPITSLRIIDLKHNNLHSLSESSLPLKSLKTLDIRDNPFVCNCSLLWLGSLINEPNASIDITDVKCNEPDKLRGIYLSRATSSQLLCVDIVLQIVIGVIVICLSSVLIFGLFYFICRLLDKTPKIP